MRASDDKLRLRDPSDINTVKLRDETIRKKQIKFESLCPNYAFYFQCTNLILKGYCPYEHIEDCRKAYMTQIDYIERG